jgi:hypothetical protein
LARRDSLHVSPIQLIPRVLKKMWL